jgi:hypothetical protein
MGRLDACIIKELKYVYMKRRRGGGEVERISHVNLIGTFSLRINSVNSIHFTFNSNLLKPIVR